MRYNAAVKGVPRRCEYIFGVANAHLFDFVKHFFQCFSNIRFVLKYIIRNKKIVA